MAGRPFPRPANPEPMLRRMRKRVRRRRASTRTIYVVITADTTKLQDALIEATLAAKKVSTSMLALGRAIGEGMDQSWAAQQRKL